MGGASRRRSGQGGLKAVKEELSASPGTIRRSNHFATKSSLMHIWVDADACPNTVKEILFRSANRLHINMTLVANRLLHTPPSPWIKAMQVPSGFDVADARIVELLAAGDLVITADIPLAALVIEKGGHALNPRGQFYTKENIRESLSMRDFMEQLRSSGVETGGPAPLAASDSKAFANQLDRFLAKQRPAG